MNKGVCLRGKNSQITIFLILGVFLIIIFFVFFNISSSLREAKLQNDLANTLDSSSKSAFEISFRTCVQDKTENLLSTILRQGGILYDKDGGINIRDSPGLNTYYDPQDNLYYNYGVLADTSFLYSVPKNYEPRLGSDSIGLFVMEDGVSRGLFRKEGVSSPFFGTNNLNKLCNREGPNDPLNSNSPYSCLPELYNFGEQDLSESVQSQINHALSLSVKSCLSSTEIEHNFDFDFLGGGDIDFILGDDDVVLDINMTIFLKEDEEIIELKDFRYNFPYRFKTIYTLGHLIAQKDIEDIYFDKRSSYKDLNFCGYDKTAKCFDDKLDVRVYNNVFGTFDDLVVIQDRGSKLTHSKRVSDLNNVLGDDLDSSSFLTMYFLVENRRPYLEYIEDQPIDLSITGDDFSSSPKNSNDRMINFKFMFYDPDDFDTDLIADSSVGTLMEITRLSGSSKLDEIPLSSGSNSFDVNFELKCSSQCDLNPREDPFNELTKYLPTDYIFRARIRDEAGLEDFQEFELEIRPS